MQSGGTSSALHAAARDGRAIRDKAAKQTLRRAIEALAGDPCPRAAKKLRGEPGLWRLPLGDWRVVCTVEADRLLAPVPLGGGRGDVHERLKRRLG